MPRPKILSSTLELQLIERTWAPLPVCGESPREFRFEARFVFNGKIDAYAFGQTDAEVISHITNDVGHWESTRVMPLSRQQVREYRRNPPPAIRYWVPRYTQDTLARRTITHWTQSRKDGLLQRKDSTP